MTRPLTIGKVISKYGLVGSGKKFVYEITERLALPAMISRGAGTRDIVKQEQNGYVVEWTDKEAIGRCLLLLKENQRREDIGRKALAMTRRF